MPVCQFFPSCFAPLLIMLGSTLNGKRCISIWKRESGRWRRSTPVCQFMRWSGTRLTRISMPTRTIKTIKECSLVALWFFRNKCFLESMVEQIPLTPDTIATYNLTDDEITALKNKIDSMQYISCPLSGFTNHLITKVEGSHAKPLARTSSQTDPLPLQAAINATTFVTAPVTPPLFDSDIMSLINIQSALMPYGKSRRLSYGSRIPSRLQSSHPWTSNVHQVQHNRQVWPSRACY